LTEDEIAVLANIAHQSNQSHRTCKQKRIPIDQSDDAIISRFVIMVRCNLFLPDATGSYISGLGASNILLLLLLPPLTVSEFFAFADIMDYN
jgi:hypothetical protein